MLLFGSAAASLALEEQQSSPALLFQRFKADYNRSYASAEEEARRFGEFTAFLAKVEMRNADPENTAVHGITKFADRTAAEMRSKCGGGVANRTALHASGLMQQWDGTTCFSCSRFPEHALGAPDEFDWTEKGAVSTQSSSWILHSLMQRPNYFCCLVFYRLVFDYF